jgi:hypothetical protein
MVYSDRRTAFCHPAPAQLSTRKTQSSLNSAFDQLSFRPNQPPHNPAISFRNAISKHILPFLLKTVCKARIKILLPWSQLVPFKPPSLKPSLGAFSKRLSFQGHCASQALPPKNVWLLTICHEFFSR